jgi:hypothetical protein
MVCFSYIILNTLHKGDVIDNLHIRKILYRLLSVQYKPVSSFRQYGYSKNEIWKGIFVWHSTHNLQRPHVLSKGRNISRYLQKLISTCTCIKRCLSLPRITRNPKRHFSTNLRVFRAFSLVVRQMPRFNSQRRGTAGTSQFYCYVCSVLCILYTVYV